MNKFNGTPKAHSTSAAAQLRAQALVYSAAAMGTEDVRMAKVATLRAAIAAGTYFVSSAMLAEKLMQTMLANAAVANA